MKRKSFICDLDGTLCDTSHRQHLVEAKKWDAFYSAMDQDKLNDPIAAIVRNMSDAGHPVIFVSGRPAAYRRKTEIWLQLHAGFVDSYRLHMRPDGDFRKDSIVKEEIYKRDIKPFFDILFCIDDRKQVVDMWRANGLVCLQCAEGDF